MNLAIACRPFLSHFLGTDTLRPGYLYPHSLGLHDCDAGCLSRGFGGFLIGVPIGSYFRILGGTVDTAVMRCIDALLAFPGRLLAIALVAATGTSFLTLCVAIGVNAIPGYTRVVRAAVLVQKEKEYVEAARMSGESGGRILFAEILPNCLAPIVRSGDP